MTKEQLLEMGYREYRGEHINVYFKKDLCTHSAVCVNGDRDLFNVCRKPWILPDACASVDKVKRVVDACPSKALLYIEKESIK
ncbi:MULTISPECIES: (4Fe-4S)-binding protein [unclassified Breznakia]|uniref:(4Fe-4S)-binding protein n=1 Tax=unclassified Breznakia TaxID=2623764 RepID=UPI002475FE31|nr:MULTISPECIES: (4Fe-4S)-binding protein [unclassified Breznakia]MDH6365887.1 putative Fe-S cluster protein YjdI [Breznakia sp. PH1-1]MDH6403181.1 putative Fe-S cluster protein YjdI [Breznakia sp. PF1-11]MDH6410890.1 putative Fe-S cluster protein YjdI [Breznakia sp. PFB1-11]MDH6413053.1 putative Fe-S cluster protein YjdI [Breznakia sp. PFB1-14]MDH6415421.1 putative Fe-S cluster protein YjdI [Breznakia sp. PFB1-4]